MTFNPLYVIIQLKSQKPDEQVEELEFYTQFHLPPPNPSEVRTMGDENARRQKARQRRNPQNSIGFERYGLLREDATNYEPPKEFPPDAQDYLVGRSRCGTLSGGAKLAGISVNRVYEFRRKLGEDFRDEEDIADSVMQDAIEESLFRCGLGEESGMARVKALNSALKANKPEKYDRTQKHEVEGSVEMSWLDILEQEDKKAKQEQESNEK